MPRRKNKGEKNYPNANTNAGMAGTKASAPVLQPEKREVLLDSGELHRCLQQEILYAVVCEHFADAVLPATKELYEKIQKQNNLK